MSLGVPVDLDEILPASKQKKLVLPSTQTRSRSHSPSADRRASSKSRAQHENLSSTSVNRSQSTRSNRTRKKGPSRPPELDVPAAKMLCATTSVAISNMTDDELQNHIASLEGVLKRGEEMLEYWKQQQETALADKEVYEGVIENLVKHARKVRS